VPVRFMLKEKNIYIFALSKTDAFDRKTGNMAE
jgi:hypothetical protein